MSANGFMQLPGLFEIFAALWAVYPAVVLHADLLHRCGILRGQFKGALGCPLGVHHARNRMNTIPGSL